MPGKAGPHRGSWRRCQDGYSGVPETVPSQAMELHSHRKFLRLRTRGGGR